MTSHDDIPDWLDDLCDRFESAWKQGGTIAIESVLQEVDDGKRSVAIKPLLQLEYELRTRSGDQPTLDELRERFPEHESIVKEVLMFPTPADSLALKETFGPRIRAGERDFVELTDSLSVPVRLGRYHIKRRLGRGAMGTVFLADDEQLGREVAIKVPHGDLQRNAEVRERFEREARACAALRHPGICPVYDVCEIDGIHFICMGYIQGVPLAKYVNDAARLSEHEVAQIALDVACALAVAHDAGIVHRDLKPGNIMIDSHGAPVILDFGLALRLDGASDVRLTQDGALVGSPAYMSPEQVKGDQSTINARTDIYGLGVMMYELLVGRLPFEGSPTEVLGQILAGEPAKPSELRADVSARMEGICLQLMAQQQADRPNSMHEVATMLDEYLRGSSNKSRSATNLLTRKSQDENLVQARLPQQMTQATSARKSIVLKSLAGGAASVLTIAFSAYAFWKYVRPTVNSDRERKMEQHAGIASSIGPSVELESDQPHSAANSSTSADRIDSDDLPESKAPRDIATTSKDEYEVLFDGTRESLRNFIGYDEANIPDSWVIDGDAIMLKGSGTRGGSEQHLITKKTYQAFELTFEWKTVPGGNSGVLYWVTDLDSPPHETGVEYQILDDFHPKFGGKKVFRSGSLYGLYRPQRTASREAGQWNTARIVARGDLIEHWLNGRIVVEAVYGSDEWIQRLTRSDFRNKSGYARQQLGHICFQEFGESVWFRSIKVRRLQFEQLRQDDEQERSTNH